MLQNSLIKASPVLLGYIKSTILAKQYRDETVLHVSVQFKESKGKMGWERSHIISFPLYRIQKKSLAN